MVFDSRSQRESATKRSSIRRGKRARPLLVAADPTIGEEVKVTKSFVSSSCWQMLEPS